MAREHILSAGQFNRLSLGAIIDQTDYMRANSRRGQARLQLAARHVGRGVATMFYEPSTRTRLSFESAAHRLGMYVITTENAAEFSSAAKGETIEDSTRVIAGCADAIIMRHKENGAAARAAAVSKVPVINAGDGTGEHPTQALLDTYTIMDKKRKLGGLHIVMGGDLRHGRTARSLTRLLSMYDGNHFSFVSPPDLSMGEDIKECLGATGSTFAETDDMFGVLGEADVIYWTRTQLERHDEPSVPGAGKDPRFIIGQQALDAMNPDAIIMHPLPRVGEIETIVDDDPRATYFEQAENGLYVRMALLDMLMDDSPAIA
jgi:aspartate carbamoyltransferase catalytic subunit